MLMQIAFSVPAALLFILGFFGLISQILFFIKSKTINARVIGVIKRVSKTSSGRHITYNPICRLHYKSRELIFISAINKWRQVFKIGQDIKVSILREDPLLLEVRSMGHFLSPFIFLGASTVLYIFFFGLKPNHLFLTVLFSMKAVLSLCFYWTSFRNQGLLEKSFPPTQTYSPEDLEKKEYLENEEDRVFFSDNELSKL